MSVQCSICNSENVGGLEAIGRAALDARISWREAARQANLTHGQGLKNHMENHYQLPAEKVFDDLNDALVVELAATEVELLEKLRMSPAEVKPLYATAIRNLRGLMDTKPSQQHLIASLKGIHEITGMRMEQQMLLAFGQRMFGQVEGGPEKVELERDKHRQIEAVYEAVEAVVLE